MIKAKPIMPIWQQQGQSTHIITKKIADVLGIKTAHTGTLDPMASGVIIVLTGEERLKKYEYAHWPKTYTFEIIFGIETDTFDSMGLFTNTTTNYSEVSAYNLQNALATFIGSYTQQVPLYAAIKVKGKPLHYWARQNISITRPIRTGEIYNIKLLSLETSDSKKDEVITQIKNVAGDFRQEPIINAWQKLGTKTFLVAKCEVQMSKGLYVRTLVQDICIKLNTLGIAHNICRIKNGNFTQKDCINHRELDFGL